MNLMELTKYEIHSDKYDVNGIITDFQFGFDLSFTYNSKIISISIGRPFPFTVEALKEKSLKVMESRIAKLLSGEIKERRAMLYYWYIDERKDGDSTYLYAKGIVKGSNKFMDTTRIFTSELIQMEIDEEAEEMILHTKNSIYYCPLSYCNFHKQEKAPHLLPEFEKIKENYQGTIKYPSIEPGKVLLVLSNFDEYYFHSLYYQPEGEEESLEYTGHAHIGTFQDSYLIQTNDYRIDLRYFPHQQNIEFYAADTDGKPWFIENIGDITLYAKTHRGLFRLEPGERKEIKRQNSAKEKPLLPDGDLYPAEFLG